jgi:hypothetical protein
MHSEDMTIESRCERASASERVADHGLRGRAMHSEDMTIESRCERASASERVADDGLRGRGTQ